MVSKRIEEKAVTIVWDCRSVKGGVDYCINFSLSPQSKSLSAGDDQDKLLGEATKQVETHAFEMKTCLVSYTWIIV